jgi:hypothetical protein
VHDISLARLGLRPPGGGCQLHSGFPADCITRLALHASANSLADIGTPGRYSSEDRCGAKFDGSILLVSSNRTWALYCYLSNFLISSQNGFLVVTLSSGIIASLPGLVNNPTSVPTLLAQNLPKSSTFFLT